mmetsp:Transcript_7661/g.16787  ORF Transcript_7661/g.16787 Transcript_7661/m.16787 type:complete len:210 (+) Transcript_7661:2939-3568(+)
MSTPAARALNGWRNGAAAESEGASPPRSAPGSASQFGATELLLAKCVVLVAGVAAGAMDEAMEGAVDGAMEGAACGSAVRAASCSQSGSGTGFAACSASVDGFVPLGAEAWRRGVEALALDAGWKSEHALLNAGALRASDASDHVPGCCSCMSGGRLGWLGAGAPKQESEAGEGAVQSCAPCPTPRCAEAKRLSTPCPHQEVEAQASTG